VTALYIVCLFGFIVLSCFVSLLSFLPSCMVDKVEYIICHSALYAIAPPSVCLSVTWVDQSKTVEVRIMQLSPHVAP